MGNKEVINFIGFFVQKTKEQIRVGFCMSRKVWDSFVEWIKTHILWRLYRK